MPLQLTDAAASLLAEGRQVHVAVPSKRGPHVTPELYAWHGDRLWFAAASSTLKAKVLGRRPEAGAVVTGHGRSVVLRGPVDRFDLLDPLGIARLASDVGRAGLALGAYAVRNAPDLLAFLRDTATGRLGSRIPPRRILFALEPTAAACIENEALVACWGDWTCTGVEPAPRSRGGGEPAVAALPGLVAVPGRWFADEQQFRTAPALLELSDLDTELELSVVLDRSNGPGPAAKEGTLVRGRGTRTGRGVVQVAKDTVVEWDGVETTSTG